MFSAWTNNNVTFTVGVIIVVIVNEKRNTNKIIKIRTLLHSVSNRFVWTRKGLQ